MSKRLQNSLSSLFEKRIESTRAASALFERHIYVSLKVLLSDTHSDTTIRPKRKCFPVFSIIERTAESISRPASAISNALERRSEPKPVELLKKSIPF